MMNKYLLGFPSTHLPLPLRYAISKLLITSSPLVLLFSSTYQNVQSLPRDIPGPFQTAAASQSMYDI